MTMPVLTENPLSNILKEYWDQYHVSVRTSGVQTFDRDSFCIRIDPHKGYRMRQYNAATDQWEDIDKPIVIMIDEA